MARKCQHGCLPGNSSKCNKGCHEGNDARYASEGTFRNGKTPKERKEYKHAVTVKGIKIEWGKKK